MVMGVLNPEPRGWTEHDETCLPVSRLWDNFTSMSNISFSPLLVTRNCCRICGSTALTPVISLGDQCIAGSFGSYGGQGAVKRKIPLELVRCDPSLDQDACGLVQLKHSVPPRILYHSYFYQSGINQSMRDHLDGIAKYAASFVNLTEGDLVLDIGCNDGTLLKSYDIPGIKRLGIDPSDMVKHAEGSEQAQAVSATPSPTTHHQPTGAPA